MGASQIMSQLNFS